MATRKKKSKPRARFTPTPERLKAAILAAEDLAETLRENCPIKGEAGALANLPGFPRTQGHYACRKAADRLEAALNPKRVPFFDKRRLALTVAGWPAEPMMKVLPWLRAAADEVLQALRIEQVCSGETWSIWVHREDGAAGAKGDDAPGWSPSITSEALKSLTEAAQALRRTVEDGLSHAGKSFEQVDQTATALAQEEETFIEAVLPPGKDERATSEEKVRSAMAALRERQRKRVDEPEQEAEAPKRTEHTSGQLLTAAEVVEEFCVSRTTLARKRKAGILTGHRPSAAPGNAAFRYSKADLSRLFPQRKKHHTAED